MLQVLRNEWQETNRVKWTNMSQTLAVLKHNAGCGSSEYSLQCSKNSCIHNMWLKKDKNDTNEL